MAQDPKRPQHYGDDVVDPRTYGQMHKLNFDQVSAIKYLTRFGRKGDPKEALADINKAIHYCELLRTDYLNDLAANGTMNRGVTAVDANPVPGTTWLPRSGAKPDIDFTPGRIPPIFTRTALAKMKMGEDSQQKIAQQIETARQEDETAR